MLGTLADVPGKLKCQFCGNSRPEENFNESKRFCSEYCAAQYSVTKQLFFPSKVSDKKADEEADSSLVSET